MCHFLVFWLGEQSWHQHQHNKMLMKNMTLMSQNFLMELGTTKSGSTKMFLITWKLKHDAWKWLLTVNPKFSLFRFVKIKKKQNHSITPLSFVSADILKTFHLSSEIRNLKIKANAKTIKIKIETKLKRSHNLWMELLMAVVATKALWKWLQHHHVIKMNMKSFQTGSIQKNCFPRIGRIHEWRRSRHKNKTVASNFSSQVRC